MFIVETLVATTLLCSSLKRESGAVCVTSSGIVQVASGGTLENKMTGEIEDISGVLDVSVKRTGDTFDVSVTMENMDFEPFDKVVNCKLSLYDRYPNYTFNFDYQLAEISPALASYAA